MTMETRDYIVRFLTPAFLGDAQQNGRWRTPPFKHLLREWWRVAYAEAHGFGVNVAEMRNEEARLFGAAAGDRGKRSLVRLRLGRWDEGKLKQWPAGGKVHHPEVGRGGVSVGADLYLGYGPLAYDRNTRSTILKANAAIQAEEENRLSLACPQSDHELLDRALALIHAFGTLGGRSRNGWGSIQLEKETREIQLPLRDWKACLREEWAHAIGRDEQGGALVWRTRQTFDDWKALMKALARIKIELRTSFPFSGGGPHPSAQDRHWLSYPVTNHSVRPWGNQRRLPNSLRFKVRRDGNGRLYGVIFHMPCRPPKEFRPDTSTLSQVWQRVHQFLDGQPMLQRSLV